LRVTLTSTPSGSTLPCSEFTRSITFSATSTAFSPAFLEMASVTAG
jgi:hypothetical protein